MNRPLAVLAAILALFVLTLGPAHADTDVGDDYSTTIGSNENADDDYTGIGATTLDPAQFDTATWGRSVRSGAPLTCTGSGAFSGEPDYKGCRWWYPNWKTNCLPASTPDAAFQVLWAYRSGKDPNTLWHRSSTTNLNNLKRLIRGAGSVFAATSELDVLGSGGTLLDRKGYDKSPRFITNDGASSACNPTIIDVAVPAAVLARPAEQVKAYGVYKPGLWSWLNDNGYDAANRDYYVFVDEQGDTASQNHCVAGLTPGAESGGPAVWTMLWGPYGTGQKTDVQEDPNDPADDQMPNWGGGFSEACVNPTYLNNASDVDHVRSGDFVWVMVHEMSHLLGIDPDAPDVDNGGHLSNTWDTQGTNHGTYCGTQARSYMRPDCNNDQFWSTQAYHTQAYWSTTRWSASFNAFLWGTVKPTTYTHWDVRLTGIDYCANGPSFMCVNN